MQEKRVIAESARVETHRKRAEEYRRAAEIFKKAKNPEAHDECLDCAVLEDLMADIGLLGELVVHVKPVRV